MRHFIANVKFLTVAVLIFKQSVSSQSAVLGSKIQRYICSWAETVIFLVISYLNRLYCWVSARFIQLNKLLLLLLLKRQ